MLQTRSYPLTYLPAPTILFLRPLWIFYRPYFRNPFFTDFNVNNKIKKKEILSKPRLRFIRRIFDRFKVALSFNKSEYYGSKATLTSLSYFESEFNLPTIRICEICVRNYEKVHRGMFFTLSEVKNHGLSPLSPYLFNAVAALKSQAMPVAFSSTQSSNGTHQTGEYVLM